MLCDLKSIFCVLHKPRSYIYLQRCIFSPYITGNKDLTRYLCMCVFCYQIGGGERCVGGQLNTRRADRPPAAGPQHSSRGPSSASACPPLPSVPAAHGQLWSGANMLPRGRRGQHRNPSSAQGDNHMMSSNVRCHVVFCCFYCTDDTIHHKLLTAAF